MPTDRSVSISHPISSKISLSPSSSVCTSADDERAGNLTSMIYWQCKCVQRTDDFKVNSNRIKHFQARALCISVQFNAMIESLIFPIDDQHKLESRLSIVRSLEGCSQAVHLQPISNNRPIPWLLPMKYFRSLKPSHVFIEHANLDSRQHRNDILRTATEVTNISAI